MPMKNRILALVLAFLMVVGMIPANVYVSSAEDSAVEQTETYYIGFINKELEEVVMHDMIGGTHSYSTAEFPDYLILKVSAKKTTDGKLLYEADYPNESIYFEYISGNIYIEADYFSEIVSPKGLYTTLVDDGEITLYKNLKEATNAKTVQASELAGEYVVEDVCYEESLYSMFFKLKPDENWPSGKEEYVWLNFVSIDTISKEASQNSGEQGRVEISTPVTDSEGNVISEITVTGTGIPEGAAVQAAIPTIDGESLTGVFEIKILKADGITEWQPIDDGQTVTISIPVEDMEDGSYVDVYHFLDYKEAMKNSNVKYLDIRGADERLLTVLADAVANSDREGYVAYTSEKVYITDGKINIQTNSFSVYTFNDKTYKFEEVVDSKNQQVKIQNKSGSEGLVWPFYATPDVTFSFITEEDCAQMNPYSIISEYDGDKAEYQDDPPTSDVVTSSAIDNTSGLFEWKKEATLSIPEEINIGDVIWIKFKGVIYSNYIKITIVREVKVNFDKNLDGIDVSNIPTGETFATDGLQRRYSIPIVNNALPQAANDDYTFVEWNTSSLGDGESYTYDAESKSFLGEDGNSYLTPSGNITLFAIWEAEEYTVEFKNKIGDTEEDVYESQVVKTGTKIQLPDGPSRGENYTFRGWSSTPDGKNTIYSAGTEMEITSDCRLYAVWEVELSITIPDGSTVEMMTTNDSGFDSLEGFEQNGNTYNLETVEGFHVGTRFRITAPEGKNFTVSNGYASGAAVTFWVSADKKTLYAELTEGLTTSTHIVVRANTNQYIVTYITNGGASIAPQEVSYNSNITLPADNTRTGYTFMGWYTDAELTQKAASTQNIKEHKTFYAKWQINQYTFTFLDSDGTTVLNRITQDYNTVVVPTNPSKEGYSFVGWSDTVPTTMPAANRTFTAQWEINQYTITFVDTDNSTITSITKNYGEVVTSPADPTKTGYTFVAWDKAIPETMPGEDVIITAQWKANEYTITWLNGYGGTVLRETLEYKTSVTAPDDPEREGYKFAGWNKTIPTTMPAEEIVITALWKLDISATVNNGGKILFQFGGFESEGTESFFLPDVQEGYGKGATVTFTPAEHFKIVGVKINEEPTDFSLEPDGSYIFTYEDGAIETVAKIEVDTTLITYTVTWKNWNGTVLETDKDVPYGTKPTYDGDEPVKIDDVQYVYTFEGWTPEVTEIEDNMVYTAVFSEERALANLTITISGMLEDEIYVFHVKDNNDAIVNTVVFTGDKSTIIIQDLPVGMYKVDPVSEWNWRQTITETAGSSSNVNLVTGDANVSFKCVKSKWNWLSDCSYGILNWTKKGGSN